MKKWLAILLITTFFIIFIPIKAEAAYVYPGGLLRGKIGSIYWTDTIVGTETFTQATDGDEATNVWMLGYDSRTNFGRDNIVFPMTNGVSLLSYRFKAMGAGVMEIGLLTPTGNYLKIMDKAVVNHSGNWINISPISTSGYNRLIIKSMVENSYTYIYEVEFYTTTELEPPAEVTNLTTTSVTPVGMTVGFTTPATADFDSYKVYVNGVLNHTSTAGQSKSTARAIPITGLAPNTSYTIKVTTIDALGNVSEGATKQQITAPQAEVTNLTTTSVTAVGMTAGFTTPATADFDSYKIYANGVLKHTATAGQSKSTVRSIPITGLTGSTSYTIKVTTISVTGSESVGVTKVQMTAPPPDLTPPDEVSNLTVTNIQPTTATLNFTTPATTDFTRYKIYKGAALVFTSTTGQAKSAARTFSITGLVSDNVYTYKVTTVDTSANESAGASTTFRSVDIIPPAAPAGLTTTPGNGKATLNWSANSEPDIKGYNIFRDGIKINTAPINARTYSDPGLLDLTVYTYRITAVDNSGNESVQSTQSTVETLAPPDLTAPAAPAGLSAAVGDQKVQLFWQAVTAPDLNGYFLYRNGVKVNTTPLKAMAYMDINLTNGTIYSYQVSAVDLSGNESALSSSLDITPAEPPDTIAPATPTGLTATPGNGQATLSWNANGESDLAGYNLYRDGVKVNGTPITVLSITDSGRNNGTTYSYRISAVDLYINESALSAPISVKPNMPIIARVKTGNSKVTVLWGVIHGATSYKILRDGVEIAEASGSPYVDENLTNDTHYQYRVVAIVDGEEGAISRTIGATPSDFIDFSEEGNRLPAFKDVFKSAYNFIGQFPAYLILLFGLMLVGTIVGFIIWLLSKLRKNREWQRVKQAELRDQRDPIISARVEAARREFERATSGRSEREAPAVDRVKEEIGKQQREQRASPITTGLAARRQRFEPTEAATIVREQRSTRTGRSGRDGRK